MKVDIRKVCFHKAFIIKVKFQSKSESVTVLRGASVDNAMPEQRKRKELAILIEYAKTYLETRTPKILAS